MVNVTKFSKTMAVSDEWVGDEVVVRLMAGLAILEWAAEIYDRNTGTKHDWRPFMDAFGTAGLTIRPAQDSMQ